MAIQRYAPLLTDAVEAVLFTYGQSNNNPKGLRTNEGFVEAPELALVANGQDLAITSISGSTVNVSDTLTADAHIGQEIRLIWTVYGQATATARPGKGVVTANGTGSLTVTWDVSPTDLPAAPALVTFAALSPGEVTFTSHGLQAGDRVVFTGGTPPAEITLGVTYYVRTVLTGSTFTIAATLGGTAINFSGTGSGSTTCTPTFGGYVHWADGRGLSYSNVRVLTPYLPEAFGDYPAGLPAVPNADFPDAADTYEKAGLFLDFTFHEGVDGYGISNSGATVTYGPDTLTDTSLALLTNVLAGAYFQVGDSIRRVASNTATAITFDTSPAWASGTPAAETEYEGFVAHYRDNPHSRTHGYGFRAPSNIQQPTCWSSVGFVYNRPRGRLVPGYVTVTGSGASAAPTYRMGLTLPMGHRLSTILGRRINIVHLAVDSAGFTRTVYSGFGGSPQQIGWWKPTTNRDWVIDGGDNLAARAVTLVDMVPNALLAAGETRTAAFIGAQGMQGETETTTATLRAMFGQLMVTFYAWFRKLVFARGLTPFSSAQDLPVVHAELNPTWNTNDPDEEVNTSVVDLMAKDPAGESFNTDASPLRAGDLLHFNGRGDVVNGFLSGDAFGRLVNTALQVAVDDATAIEICNMALHNIGDKGRIESLDPAVDGSTQAKVCAQHFQHSQDAMFEEHCWRFAMGKAPLVAVTCTNPAWTYAYALPADCADAIAVIPATASDDFTMPEATTRYGDVITYAQDVPLKFEIETDDDGYEVLFTDEVNAHLRYTRKVNSSLRRPSLFKIVQSWRLAGLIAGALIKGDEGRVAIQHAERMVGYWMNKATAMDARQRKADVDERAPWDRHR